ncbi:hypothetical protein NIES3275_68350 [Microchaete diplosiphon NIES-3275]|nr:hypothetical protein NIES3275_68350 [Microchaete diplosiphon NIES-3275]
MSKKNLVQINNRRKKRGLKKLRGIQRPTVYSAIEPCSITPVLIGTARQEQSPKDQKQST